MNCPKCASPLTKKYYKGMMEVDSCPVCRGMWLDFDELDRLEDLAFDDDARKGSLLHRETSTEYRCPACAAALTTFQYRLYDLRLEACPQKHGFWLDAAEDERVLQIMRERAGQLQRQVSAEQSWRQTLRDLHHFLKKS
ncbi:MAG: hypothetical protein OHK0031_03540 [Anaerolineales bacterium]